jgi:hypothetical protein
MSALYTVFRVIPTFPMFGIPGASFRAGDFFAPLYGIVLGPVLGPLSVVLGTVIGFSLGAPPVFLFLDFLPAATCAAVVGLVTRRRRKTSTILNVATLAFFLLLPFTAIFIRVGNYLVPYIWLHLVGLALLVSPLSLWAAGLVGRGWTEHPTGKTRYIEKQFLGVLVLAFIGTLVQHLMGGVLTQLVVGLNFHSIPGKRGQFQTWQDFWTFIFWIYPIERSVIALVAAALAAPTLVALKVSGLSHRLPKM